MRKFSPEFYVFCTPRNDPDANSYIKIIEPDCLFAGAVFVIHYIKIRRRFGFFGRYILKYHYDVIEPPADSKADTKGREFKNLIGDIIFDIWDKYYS